jgi:hypothetical protein
VAPFNTVRRRAFTPRMRSFSFETTALPPNIA